jgi:PAS domain S-box-containing protein
MAGAAMGLDLSRLFDRLPDGILVVDETGRIVLANPAAASIFGVADLTGTDMAHLIPSESHEQYQQLFKNTLSASGAAFVTKGPVRVHATRVDGVVLELEMKVTVTDLGTGGPLLVASFRVPAHPMLVDRPHEIAQYLNVAVDLAEQLNSLETDTEAYAAILPTLCRQLDWDVACLWVVAADGHHLRCVSTFPDDGGPTQSFEDVSRGLFPSYGEGLPGSAWSSGRPLVTSVGQGEMPVLRQSVILRSGLRTGLAVPVVFESRTVGVIEMFSVRNEPVSPHLLDGLASIGRQIGQLLYQFDVEGDLRRRERSRAFLLDAATGLASSTDYADALRRLAAQCVPELADLCLIDVRERNGTIVRMAAIHADPEKERLVDELAERYPPASGSAHPSYDVILTGRSMWSSSMPDEFLRATTHDQRHFEIVKALGFESYMCVPLRSGDETLGTITLVSAGSGRKFQLSDLALPEELAGRAASVIATARRHDQEHRLARELQRLLLPEALPEFDEFDICVRYLAGAPDAEAGGDFYDVVRLPSERLGLMIGDVEGHDTLAAATMGQLRSATRALAGQVQEPSQLIDALRWSWDLLSFERVATAIFGRVDHRSGEGVLSSAGHLPPAVIEPGGEARFLDVKPSPPLGAPGGPATDHRFVLERGASLLLYTDGLIEERDVPLSVRLAGLLGTLAQAPTETASELGDAILERFAPTKPLRDDLAILVVRRR